MSQDVSVEPVVRTSMTLEYARILDRTVEQSFTQAVEQMQVGPLSWVPSFFQPEEYQIFAEGDTVSWIRLPHGFCCRNPATPTLATVRVPLQS